MQLQLSKNNRQTDHRFLNPVILFFLGFHTIYTKKRLSDF